MKPLRVVLGGLGVAWLFAGLFLLVVLVLELAARVLLFAWVGTPDPDPRIGADTYAGASWPREYYDEYEAAGAMRWEPYLYWRRMPFSGRHIRVDERGRRRTWSPAPGSVPGRPAQVLFLGGSTAWGTGARDDQTIPSLLARSLAERGIAAEVTNLAESGHTNTQGLIALLLELRAGRIPDLAVFYDGANEVGSAHTSGAGGLPFNECHRVHEFNLLNARRRRDLHLASLRDLFASSGIGRIRAMLRDRRLGDGRPTCPELRHADTSDAALAREIVAAYASNLERIGTLARAHGFRVLFAWQPTAFRKPSLTPFERETVKGQERLESLFAATRDRRRATASLGANPDYVDLEDLFAESSEPLFVDWAHVGERGNARVAQALIPLVEERLGGAGRPESRRSRTSAPGDPRAAAPSGPGDPAPPGRASR